MTDIVQELPGFFTHALHTYYDEHDVDRIVCGCQVERATTLRVNTLRATRDQLVADLSAAGISLEPVSFYNDAFVVSDPNEQLWKTDALHQGHLYVQSLSSMLPPLFMDARAGMDVLDMCAAPGGKTTELAALCANAAHITACELNAVRADKLEFNLRKQGAENVLVLRQDARKLDSFFSFDRVLLDAPCSGSGTLNANDPKLAKRFSEALVKDSCKKQSALLAKALEIIKPGCFVLYSTCSVLKCENEDIVQAALARANKRGSYRVSPFSEDALPDVPLLPSALEGAITVCPTALFEGFFMCKITRYE